MTMTHRGIQLKGILPSSRLGIVSMDDSIPFETQSACPGCLTKLTTLVSLTSKNHSRVIRVGVCENCGYMGYIDRPTRDWIVTFYATDWDKEFMRTPDQMRTDVNMQKGGVKGSRYDAFSLHEKLQLDKNRPVCDIGCGYGLVMENLRRVGFTNVYGVENSPHRANLVRDVFNLPVIEGDFGSDSVEQELKAHAPFGLMFSHHVLEHVYNPNEVIASMARLQKEGDYAIFALPDVAGEHINYVSLYLPHVHGFTKESLEALFNRHGYEVVADASPNILNQNIAFRKVSNPKPYFQKKSNYLAEARERVKKGLDLDSLQPGTLYELRWDQLITERDTAQATAFGEPNLISRLSWMGKRLIAYIKSRMLKRFTAHYILLGEALAEPRSTEGEFEIQYDKAIKLFIK